MSDLAIGKGAGARRVTERRCWWLLGMWVSLMLLWNGGLNAAAVREIGSVSVVQPNVNVLVRVTPDAGVAVYALEEVVPAGWQVEAISENGVFESQTATLRWGPFFDNQGRAFSYTLVPPPNAAFAAVISGRASFDGEGRTVTGDTAIDLLGESPVIADPKPTVHSRRMLPASIVPNEPFSVSIQADPPASAAVYAVEEVLSAGLSPFEISDGGTFDPTTRTIRWGPFFDPLQRIFVYQARWMGGNERALGFVGNLSVDGVSQTIGGDQETSVSGANQAPDASSANRRVAVAGASPQIVEVTIAIQPDSGVAVFAVEEQVPSGFAFLDATLGGQLDPLSQALKWGPFFDDQARELSYRLSASSELSGSFALEGVVSIDGRSEVIGGTGRVQLGAGSGLPSGNGVAIRMLPNPASPSSLIEVGIQVQPPSTTSVYAIEEILPAGTVFQSASEGGEYDPATGAVKWGPFFDAQARSLSYAIRLGLGQPSRLSFSGVVSRDGMSEGIAGQSLLVIRDGEIPGPPQVVDCPGVGGLLTFSNPRGQVRDLDGELIGTNVLGQVYVGRDPNRLVPICAPVSAFGLGVFTGGEIVANGFAGGETVWVQLRAWRGAERYESASVRGASDVIAITLKSADDLVPAPVLSTAPFQLTELQAPELLPLRVSEGLITVGWLGSGNLQSSEDPAGPYVTLENQANPQSHPILPGTQRFFRVVVE